MYCLLAPHVKRGLCTGCSRVWLISRSIPLRQSEHVNRSFVECNSGTRPSSSGWLKCKSSQVDSSRLRRMWCSAVDSNHTARCDTDGAADCRALCTEFDLPTLAGQHPILETYRQHMHPAFPHMRAMRRVHAPSQWTACALGLAAVRLH